jgi:methyltransferase (TIGR00027 family)
MKVQNCEGKYMQKSDSIIYSAEKNTKRKGPSKMAELIALHRVAESALPEDQRICYDPYAVHFVDPEILEFARKNPEKTKAMREHYERLFSGLGNSIRARVRYFDDFVKAAIGEGLEQLVILGAGYDTRAYRIEGLKGNANVKVFEVDHPGTQSLKMEKIEKIFGKLPDHVMYVPIDFEMESMGQKLLASGYDKSKKTLFIIEGLVMYIPPRAVDEMLSFIVNNSSKGSTVLFDYFLQPVVDGTCEIGKNMRDFAAKQGEPFLFGIEDGAAEAFLMERGFSQVKNVTSDDYKKAYFYGVNKDRTVCSLLLFVHAVVEPTTPP